MKKLNGMAFVELLGNDVVLDTMVSRNDGERQYTMTAMVSVLKFEKLFHC